MTGISLTARQRFVLGAIVENFIVNATPVGSKYIAEECRLPVSPATIRNVMLDLEKRGLIKQPHTSAGRVPTDKGYRFYVNSLMKVPNISQIEKKKIYDTLEKVSSDLESVLEAASHTLASISKQLGVILAPRFYQGVFDRMELIPIAENKILVVISIKSGLVKTITLEIEKHISKNSLEETARIINGRLHGLTLREIQNTIEQRLHDISTGNTAFIDLVLRSSQSLFNFSAPSDVHVVGTRNIMFQPEFADQSALEKLMGLLDDKQMLIHVFDRVETESQPADAEKAAYPGGRIRIAIGQENEDDLVRHCSLVTATYRSGNASGMVGVIGPTRMEYANLVALVDFMAEILSNKFNPISHDS